MLHVSEDAFRGDAQFVVIVDGHQLGGTKTATTAHKQGHWHAVTLTGDIGAGPHSVAVTFLNDACDGAGHDRNLYVGSIDLGGVQFAAATAALFASGTTYLLLAATGG